MAEPGNRRGNTPIAAAIAGLISAVLFLLPGSGPESTSTLLLMPLITYLPTLPLLTVGLLHTARASIMAAAFATFIIVPFAQVEGGVLYLLLMGLPAILITALLLKPVKLMIDDQSREIPLPASRLVTMVTTAVVFLMIVCSLALLSYPGTQEEATSGTGMAAFVADALTEAANTPGVTDEMKQALQQQAPTLAFLLPALSGWLWVLLLLANTAIAFRLASRLGIPLRSGWHMDAVPPPSWMLVALMLAGVTALFASPWLAYIGQLVFVMYLLPYLVSGMAPLHRAMARWPMQEVWLTLAYGLAIMLFWPALGLALYAILRHCLQLNQLLTRS